MHSVAEYVVANYTTAITHLVFPWVPIIGLVVAVGLFGLFMLAIFGRL